MYNDNDLIALQGDDLAEPPIRLMFETTHVLPDTNELVKRGYLKGKSNGFILGCIITSAIAITAVVLLKYFQIL